MLKKGQKLYSILFAKCPRCHEGDLWKMSFSKSALGLLKGQYNMHERCSKCNLKYEQEPGFWWGAMYISYALSSGALLITAFTCRYVINLTINQTFLMILLVALIGFLYNARVSRAIFINFFVHYEKKS